MDPTGLAIAQSCCLPILEGDFGNQRKLARLRETFQAMEAPTVSFMANPYAHQVDLSAGPMNNLS